MRIKTGGGIMMKGINITRREDMVTPSTSTADGDVEMMSIVEIATSMTINMKKTQRPPVSAKSAKVS